MADADHLRDMSLRLALNFHTPRADSSPAPKAMRQFATVFFVHEE